MDTMGCGGDSAGSAGANSGPNSGSISGSDLNGLLLVLHGAWGPWATGRGSAGSGDGAGWLILCWSLTMQLLDCRYKTSWQKWVRALQEVLEWIILFSSHVVNTTPLSTWHPSCSAYA